MSLSISCETERRVHINHIIPHLPPSLSFCAHLPNVLDLIFNKFGFARMHHPTKRQKTEAEASATEDTMASVWSENRHYLYEMAVQETGDGSWMQRFAENYSEIRHQDARSLREDFCGTFSNCCNWIELHPANTAVGLDNDAEVIQWGLKEFGSVYSGLEGKDQQRISIRQQDVLQETVVDKESFDVVCALNFSYSVFKQRAKLVQYFTSVAKVLKDNGLFFIDVHGGQSVQRCNYKIKHAIEDADAGLDGAEYEWHQEKWDPVTSRLLCHINFHFPDGSSITPAFSYDWRHYSMSEIRDALTDSGLTEQHVFFPDVDSAGQLTGKYSDVKATAERDDETWTAYIAAGKCK